MKTIAIPFRFSMDDCFWFGPEGTTIQLTAQIELSDEEVRLLKETDRSRLKQDHPDLYQKLEDAVDSVCRENSYRYALITEFSENGVIHENEEKMMDVFAKEGLFDPEESYGGEDKLADFAIWLEEYFFDLTDEEMVRFIEKYYGYAAGRLTEEKMAYKSVWIA